MSSVGAVGPLVGVFRRHKQLGFEQTDGRTNEQLLGRLRVLSSASLELRPQPPQAGRTSRSDPQIQRENRGSRSIFIRYPLGTRPDANTMGCGAKLIFNFFEQSPSHTINWAKLSRFYPSQPSCSDQNGHQKVRKVSPPCQISTQTNPAATF